MKKVILTIMMLMLIAMPIFAQNFEDYILESRGDTVVVKDQTEMGDPNSIINAIELDEDPPEGRVYELHTNGYYFITRQMVTPTERPLRLVGEDDTPLVASDNAEEYPPLLAGTTEEGEPQNGDMVAFNDDLVMKNMIAVPAATDNSFGWTFLISSTPNNSIVMDNVLMEHTKWVMMQSNDHEGNSFHIKNSYFVNMSGEPCRRNGGVYDNVSHNTDTMYVENSTHIMAQGILYKFRGFPVNRAFFNHNTFVNCAGQVLCTMGYQSDYMVTNNLFVNSNVQGYRPGLDYGETDQDSLPMGIINVNHIPDDFSFEVPDDADRKILVQNNGVYWDESLDQIVTELNDLEVDGYSNWETQMIKMNSRTQDMFNNEDRYPKLVEGNWIEAGDPNFTDPHLLMTDALNDMIDYCIAAASEDNAEVMDLWRAEDNPAEDNWVYPDFPMPADLSYSNEDYLTAGYAGFPLGDLNWFPEEKEAWLAQKDAEHDALNAAQNAGELSIKKENATPDKFELSQNYPNPFNPTTSIKYTVPRQANVTLKVYNALGQEIATLDDGLKEANTTHKVTFNASDLSSGIYIYTLESNGRPIQSKKMVLIK